MVSLVHGSGYFWLPVMVDQDFFTVLLLLCWLDIFVATALFVLHRLFTSFKTTKQTNWQQQQKNKLMNVQVPSFFGETHKRASFSMYACWTSCGPIKQIELARSVVYWTCQVNRLVKQSKTWACGFPRCFGMPCSYEQISGWPTTQTLFGSSCNLPPQRLCELRKERLHWRLISGRLLCLKTNN